MLGKIICCTLVVSHYAETLRAWQRWLDYRLMSAAPVSPEAARVWGAEAMAGARTALLVAASGAPSYVRLIEGVSGAGAEPVLTWGWNAVEILVADVYQLARRLAGSPFEIAVAPRPLPFDERIHAMQVVGPGGELLYLTQLPAEATPFDLSAASTPVDRPFIAILGGPALSPMLDFYRDRFGNTVSAAEPTVIRIVNERFGLPAGQRTPLGIVHLARGFLLELDESPPAARERVRRAGELPPGLALVAFEVPARTLQRAPCRASSARLGEPPYGGGRVGVVEGRAGEWIELIANRRTTETGPRRSRRGRAAPR